MFSTDAFTSTVLFKAHHSAGVDRLDADFTLMPKSYLHFNLLVRTHVLNIHSFYVFVKNKKLRILIGTFFEISDKNLKNC